MDASSYLYRAFHALPPLSNSKGEATGVVKGAISVLRRLLMDLLDGAVTGAFDAKGKTFCEKLYAEYPWSSYQYNAPGKAIELITPHFLYWGLEKIDKTRQKRYAALFDEMILGYTLEEIRHSINRAWVLGDERFNQQIEKQTDKRVSPLARGGDRKSVEYRAKS